MWVKNGSVSGLCMHVDGDGSLEASTDYTDAYVLMETDARIATLV